MQYRDYRKQFFKQNGYWIERNLYDERDMKEMFVLFYDVFLALGKRNHVPFSHQYPDSCSVSFPSDIKELDLLILDVFKFDKKLIGEAYDTISYSSTFMRFLGNPKIEEITKELLDLDKDNALYGWTNRVRIDPPKDERRTYGWHQEVFYTIPETRFLQTWAPVIRNTSINNGTIEICPGSHKAGIACQSWNEIDGRATQIIVADEVVSKYNNVQLEMQLGEVLFFDGHLFHRSGHNSTIDEVRFSLVGMWNDVNHPAFRCPKPQFQHRTELSQKQYWEKINTELSWGF